MRVRKLANCPIEIAGRAVHVWPVLLEASGGAAKRFEVFLKSDERQRAAQFRLGHLRDSFVIARGVLRLLLAHYLHLPPGKINLMYGPNGKPAVVTGTGLAFNLSHSGDLAVFAFATGCEIGVDVEQILPIDMQGIADRFFCPEESAEIKGLPEDGRERGFYRGWTRKEACVKALGEGLSAQLDGFRVSLKSDQPGKLIHLARGRGVAQAFTIHDLDVSPNFAGALVYSGTERPVARAPLLVCTELLNFVAQVERAGV